MVDMEDDLDYGNVVDDYYCFTLTKTVLLLCFSLPTSYVAGQVNIMSFHEFSKADQLIVDQPVDD
jgi:hypothetical protein